MPKASKKQKSETVIQEVTKFKALHNLEPWSCHSKDGQAVIEAYVMAKGDWQTIATIQQTAHIDAEATARYITRAVNDYEHNHKLINDLVAALELCVDCDGLTWEAEQEAEIVLRRVKEEKYLHSK